MPVSAFLSPAYVIFSAGMNYKASDDFNMMLSPLTSKTTIVVKEGAEGVDETQYGIKEGERIYREVGAYLKIHYKFNITKEISAENDLTLFSNYQYKPQNLDLDLKSELNFKINKNIKALISLHFIYDDDSKIPYIERNENGEDVTKYTVGLQFQEKIMIGIGANF